MAAPWHLYQIIFHREWFWADFVEVQLLGFGTRPPVGAGGEGALWFYARRIGETDPVLAAMAAVGAAALVRKCARRESGALVIGAWLAVMAGALAAFGYHNLPYALPAIPALVLTGAAAWEGKKWARWAAVGLAGAMVVKAGAAGKVWGLTFGRTEAIAEARPLRAYWESGRGNGLMMVAPADEFYSFTLPGLAVRYVFVDPEGVVARYAPHYVWLGITVTGEEFEGLAGRRAEYEKRLREWGVTGGGAVATAVRVRDVEEVRGMVRRHAELDFEMPEGWAPEGDGGHEVKAGAAGRVFLLARGVVTRVKRGTLPADW